MDTEHALNIIVNNSEEENRNRRCIYICEMTVQNEMDKLEMY